MLAKTWTLFYKFKGNVLESSASILSCSSREHVACQTPNATETASCKLVLGTSGVPSIKRSTRRAMAQPQKLAK